MICNEREKYNKETNECESICKKGEIYDLDLNNCISICLKGEKYYEEIDLFKEKNIFFWNIKFF